MKATKEIAEICDRLTEVEAKLDKLLERKKSKPRSSKVEYPDWFEHLWAEYPKRVGSNPKKQAFESANARLNEASLLTTHEKAESMWDGLVRYGYFCDETGKTGTELVMQAKRFFGTGREYEGDWTIPIGNSIPKDDSMLADFAVEHGLHEPGKAPAHIRNPYEYRKWIKAELK